MSSISIYIPAVRHFVSAQQMKYEIEYQDIGKVLRIDFAKRGKPQHRFLENDVHQDKLYKSAFVHFERLYNSKIAQNMVTCIETGNSFCLQLKTINENYYWLILQNHNPLPDTSLNTPQIVDKCKYLEFKVSEQADELSKLKLQMKHTNTVIEQLIGGLFCQTTQSSVIETHLSHLHGVEVADNITETEESINPTTRQGYQNAEKIETLELQNKKMSEILWNLTGKEVFVYEPIKESHSDCDSVSTHSSMPSLICDIDYNSTVQDQLHSMYSLYYQAVDVGDYENIV